MGGQVRIYRSLYQEMLLDLQRPRVFGGERVGFAFGRMGAVSSKLFLVLLYDYTAIGDQHYMDDPKVGARIDGAAIHDVMERALQRHEGVFHVHLHAHVGRPSLGTVDRRELPRLFPSFSAVEARQRHGLLLLSLDSLVAYIWEPSVRRAVMADRITVVGSPLKFIRGTDDGRSKI